MKKSTLFVLFSLQILTLVGVAATAYFTFMNKARIRATQRVMLDTQEKLGSTFAFMDKMTAQEKKAEAAKQPLAQHSQAPAFSLQNENDQEVSLADYKGKKTLLVFTQESCSYCQEFFPVLNEFQVQRDDIQIVVMQLDSTPAQNKKFKQEQGINAPILATTVNELKNYKIQKTPTSVLVDETGHILATETIIDLLGLTAFVEESLARASNDTNAISEG